MVMVMIRPQAALRRANCAQHRPLILVQRPHLDSRPVHTAWHPSYSSSFCAAVVAAALVGTAGGAAAPCAPAAVAVARRFHAAAVPFAAVPSAVAVFESCTTIVIEVARRPRLWHVDMWYVYVV